MSRRTVALSLAALALAGSVGASGRSAPAPAEASIDAYRGLGTWVDIYDEHQLAHPWRTVRRARAHGVKTIFLETSNARSHKAIVRPKATEGFIRAAHRDGLKIVAWYLPGFDDLERDYNRTMRAIRYKTRHGGGFDGFAMDIESTNVKSIPLRERRMLRLSRRVRAQVGTSYALGAIIPSPSDMAAGSYWGHDFAFKEVAGIYDVLLPMAYSSFRAEGLAQTHDYISRSIKIIRRETGDRKTPIHAIGGLSDGSTGREVRGFVHAVRENGLIGGSYYDFGLTRSEDWAELAKVSVTPHQDPALPLEIGYAGPLGNVPGEDESHPREIFYRAPATEGPQGLSFEAFDVQPGEVQVWVNWQRVATVAPTDAGEWSETRSIVIGARYLRSDRPNFISFAARGSYPDWSTWGIRDIGLGTLAP